MKALMFYGKEDLRFVDIAKPEIKENEVLLKIKKVGICGTDLHIYHGGMAVPTPLVIGHEFVGEVAEIGSQVTNVKVGDKAAAEHVVGCGECQYCKSGKKNICVKPTVFGLDRPGALAEYMAIPAELVFPLPDGMDYDAGVLVEPLSIAVYAVGKSGLSAGDDVAVIGQGPIGLFIDQIATVKGAKVVGIDVLNDRLNYAKSKGLIANFVNSKEQSAVDVVKDLTDGRGIDYAFEVVGREETLTQAIDIVNKGGKVMVLGVFSKPVSLDMMKVVKREISVCGAWTCLNSFPETIEMLSSNKISTSDFITHRYKFENAIQAFVDASSYSEGRIKSVIELE
jgi:2-desacetyl-2-hydroxyethyl bacteriochlorophyllide A dehydrogenase